MLRGARGGPRTGRVSSSNLPEHPISSRDSGSSMGPVGGTSAESGGFTAERVEEGGGSLDQTGSNYINYNNFINYSGDDLLH